MDKFKGMTVNERLYSLNQFEAFDKAIKSRSTQQAISILVLCELPNEEATKIVQSIFQDPEMYGY